MTREEEISKAAYSQYCNSESIRFNLMCDSFKQGAKWADEHSDLSSLWHDANEEPDIENTDVYVLYIDKYNCARLQLLEDILTYYDNKITWDEAVRLCSISKWVYVRDLLPK